ncbi:hypothetical protein ACWCP6_07420 [Streptomyces sp. NPDC002004]
MRASPRIVSTLAGLAIALGGTVVATAPAAHADLDACHAYVESQGVTVTDAVRMACYVGLVGDQPGCVRDLTQLHLSDTAATEACRRAP